MSPAPPYPLEGVVSWNMNTTCNYRCSYCTQRFVEDRGRWARDWPRFVDAFARLPGDWEVKCSGGEPFRHPDFLEVVEAMVARGLRVSVVTNLSASEADLDRFCDLVRSKPGLISASLHREHVDDDTFLAKAARVAEWHAGALCVTCVATRAWLPELPALRDRFEAAGLVFKVQPEKQDRDVIPYDDDELALLRALGGHNGTGFVAPSFAGSPCWAGARYLVVDDRGEAWRCYPARRYRREHLGNVLDGTLRVRREAEPCRYTYCNCTVPQQRAMVQHERAEEAPCRSPVE